MQKDATQFGTGHCRRLSLTPRRLASFVTAPAAVLLTVGLLWRTTALPVALLVPSDFAFRGQCQSSARLPADSGGGLPPCDGGWSLIGVRQGAAIEGKLVVPGHKMLQGATVLASLENGRIEGVIRSPAGETIGKVQGVWGITGAEGTYELVTGESGTWSWSRTPSSQPLSEL